MNSTSAYYQWLQNLPPYNLLQIAFHSSSLLHKSCFCKNEVLTLKRKNTHCTEAYRVGIRANHGLCLLTDTDYRSILPWSRMSEEEGPTSCLWQNTVGPQEKYQSGRLYQQHIYTISELQDSEESCRKLLSPGEGGKIDRKVFPGEGSHANPTLKMVQILSMKSTNQQIDYSTKHWENRNT